MYTLEDINAMTETEAKAVVTTLATKLCGSDRFKTDLAKRIGYDRQGVNGWFFEGNRPPALAIMYLEAELSRLEAENLLNGLARNLGQLAKFA